RDDADAFNRPRLLVGAGALAELLRSIQRLELKHLKQPLADFVVIVERRFDRAEARVAAIAVGLIVFAATFLTCVAEPHDTVAPFFNVAIAAATRRAFRGEFALARRDVSDAVAREQLLRGDGHAAPRSKSHRTSCASGWSRPNAVATVAPARRSCSWQPRCACERRPRSALSSRKCALLSATINRSGGRGRTP